MGGIVFKPTPAVGTTRRPSRRPAAQDWRGAVDALENLGRAGGEPDTLALNTARCLSKKGPLKLLRTAPARTPKSSVAVASRPMLAAPGFGIDVVQVPARCG